MFNLPFVLFLFSETYKQSMLETTYVLVIDSKNLLDTLDEVRIQQNSASSKSVDDHDGLTEDEQTTTDTATESQPSDGTSIITTCNFNATPEDIKLTEIVDSNEQIYENESVKSN